MKGAADALCNPETDVRGGSGGGAAGHAGLRGDPSHDVPKSLGPPTPTSLQDKWAESGPAFSHKRSRVLEEALPGQHHAAKLKKHDVDTTRFWGDTLTASSGKHMRVNVSDGVWSPECDRGHMTLNRCREVSFTETR